MIEIRTIVLKKWIEKYNFYKLKLKEVDVRTRSRGVSGWGGDSRRRADIY